MHITPPSAKAMRIVCSSNARYVSTWSMIISRLSLLRPVILWDDEALNYDVKTQDSTQIMSSECTTTVNVLFSPLLFDAEVHRFHFLSLGGWLISLQTLRKVSATFGPLDHFGVFSPMSDGKRRFS